jgi:hypothetical protein
MDRLEQAVESVRDRTSFYWAYFHPEETVGGEELVEVRLNGASETVGALQPPEGWSVHRVQWDEAVYLRRHQRLTDETVEAMLLQMLAFAAKTGMQLHSWLHGGDAN